MSRTCVSCGTVNAPEVELCTSCGQLIDDLREGSTVDGRYRIEATLGRGGMGAVYRVYDEDLEETVALKVLHGDVASGPAADRRFRDEIKLARKIVHPNVCRIFEFGRQGALSYLTMELIDGFDLRGVLKRRGPLPLETVVEIGIRVCSALQAIHDAGIIHRDLKAANIMLGRDGSLKLMDFGIAKNTASGAPGATATGMIVGTPEYMSPEQVRAEPLDPRSDVYALGMVLYELFTGTPPFRGATAVETLFKQLNEPTPLQAGAETRIPEPIAPVLLMALAKERNERYASAHDMRMALEGVRTRAGLGAGSLEQLIADVAGAGASTEAGASAVPKQTAQVTKREEEVETVHHAAPEPRPPVPEPPPPPSDGAWSDQETSFETAHGRGPHPPQPRPPDRTMLQHEPESGPPRESARGGPPVAALGAVAALLVALAAVGYFAWPRSPEPGGDPAPDDAVTPATVAPAPATDAWVESESLASSSAYPVTLTPRQTTYRVGQELVIDVDVPEDGYLNVINVGRDDATATVLFPNGFQRDNAVTRGQKLTIPAPGAPFSLPAGLPEGRDEQRTLLLVIHSPSPLDAFQAGEGTGLLRQLTPGGVRSLGREAASAGGFGAGRVTILITR